MTRLRPALTAAVFAVLAGIGVCEAKVGGQVVASYGNWDVHRTVEAITGKVQCIASYRGKERVELYNTSLILLTSSWENPRAFRFRIDEGPVSRMTTASDLVWRSRTIAFGGDAFNQLLKAHRLRVEVVNLHDVREFDLALDGIYAAYTAIYHCR